MMENEFDLTAVGNFEEFLGYPKTSGGIPRGEALVVARELGVVRVRRVRARELEAPPEHAHLAVHDLRPPILVRRVLQEERDRSRREAVAAKRADL